MNRKIIIFNIVFSLCAACSGGCGAAGDFYNKTMSTTVHAGDAGDDGDPTDPTNPADPGTILPFFNNGLGNPVNPTREDVAVIAADYDGDGISNDREITTNPFVAEYPRIVTRIETPISVEIRSTSTTTDENFSETISGSDTKDTISNSMDSKQYTSLNLKTTPYVSKESYSDSVSNSSSYGVSDSSSASASGSFSLPLGGGGSASASVSNSHSENGSVADSLAKSTSTEKTLFPDVNYKDNLDRNGVELNDAKVQTMTNSYRKSGVSKKLMTIGPNAGVVSAALYLHNLSVNFPVHIANLKCTLSFRTPSGQCQPVKTFILLNDDYSQFSQDIGGDEEKGPFAIVIDGLNTNYISQALSNGWVPQISVVSYDTTLVKDSNYNPGVTNLKMVEENAKGRTAFITIDGQGTRESYRVAAFDVMSDGRLVPGQSLKKALFNILADRIGSGESWEKDKNNNPLTIADSKRTWMKGGPSEYPYDDASAANKTGNNWRSFETYIKSYTDDTGKLCHIETIKRVFALKKYNPFDVADNPNYNPSELLPNSQLQEMQYWMILHNGKYFEGDINGAIWPGERYELICVNIGDFNSHFTNYYYTPLQSMESFPLNTRWNILSDSGEFSRAKYLGQLVPGDVLHLVVDLSETRDLFATGYLQGTGSPISNGLSWSCAKQSGKSPYSFGPASTRPTGIPKDFSHTAYGLINGFEVDIDSSVNAQFYVITINGQTDASYTKKIPVTLDLLAENGNVIFIDRKTKDANGADVGFIPAGNYTVKVVASGNVYGVSVLTQSVTNSYNNSISVKSAPDSLPTAFRFTSDGMGNVIQLTVSDDAGSSAEFYEAIISGPLNPCYNPNPSGSSLNECAVRTVAIHRGTNYIEIENPLKYAVSEPGVYIVQVQAQNNYSVVHSSPTTAANIMSNAIVTYDKYAAQKSTSTRPMVTTNLEKLDAVDLEVNFNDGSGWFTLQTAGVDGNLEGRKAIDCRYTSYIDYSSQQFHVFFIPPAGPAGTYASSTNVFAGGRETADVYIRTIAKNKYRDTFWPRDDSAARILTSSTTAGWKGLVSLMTSSPLFDATCLESTLANVLTGAVPSSYNGGMSPVLYAGNNANISNYFFAPQQERQYVVYASIADSMVTYKPTGLDAPAMYTASAGLNSIAITGLIAPAYATSFKIYFKADSTVSDAQKEDIVHRWTYYTETTDLTATIPGLVRNQPYYIAVIACNDTLGIASPATIWKNGTDTVGTPVIPYGPVSSIKPTMSVSVLSSNSNEVLVNGLKIPGENRYQIWCKSFNSTAADADDASWQIYDTYRGTSAPVDGDVSHTFSLGYWTRYKFKARAIIIAANDSLANAQTQTDPLCTGPWSDVYEAETGAPSNLYGGADDSVWSTPTFTETSGSIVIKSFPFSSSDDYKNVDVIVYVQFTFSGEYTFTTMSGSGPVFSTETILSTRGTATYQATTSVGTLPFTLTVHRNSCDPDLSSTQWNSGYSYGTNLADNYFSLKTLIGEQESGSLVFPITKATFSRQKVGVKYVIHSKYSNVADLIITQGTTW